jgi:Adenylate and Guanylate cyclase catalytic domain
MENQQQQQQQQHLGDDNDALDSLVGSEIFVESELGSAATLPSAQAAAEARQIAPKEARLASLARILVYFILVVTSSLVSAGIYRDARQAQQDAFDRAFENLANQVSLGWKSHVATQLAALESLGIAITSYYSVTAAAAASSSNRTVPSMWSRVTIADFERRSAIFRRTAGAESVVLLPLVASMEAKASWESYVLDPTHQEWIAQGIEYDMKLQEQAEQLVEGSSRRHRRRRQVQESSALSGIWPTIYTMDGQSSAHIVEQSPPPFFPGWQSSPPRESWINFNFASHDVIGSSVEAAVRSKKAVISKMMGLSSTNQSIGELFLLGTNDGGGADTASPTGPTMSLVYPLYDGFGADRQIVGLLSAQSIVETLWKASLPFHSDAVEAVLENTCGQVATYRIQGETIEYRGDGTRHYTNDENDSSLEVSLDLVPGIDYLGEPLLHHSQGNSGGDGAYNNINKGGCDYVLRIYATQEMHDEYESNSPWLYAISVEVMLVLLLITFYWYDCLVGRHLKVVLDAAIKARTIVGQIYPQIVLNRLFGSNKPVLKAATTTFSQQLTNPQQEQHRHNPRHPPSDVSFASEGLNRISAVGSMASSGYDGNSTSSDLKGGDETTSAKDNLDRNNDMKFNGSSRSLRAELLPMHQLKSFLQEGAPKKALNTSEHSTDLFEYKKNSRPIADLFPSVTVLFADISGFTAWSSSREPAQVFMLLETIYRSFDRIARKLVVFKVSLWRSVCCASSSGRA